MTKKVYHLGNCGTCKRIIKELGIGEEFDYQNIKVEKMTVDQVDEMANISGSYEKLFSRRAIKYRSMGLQDKTLSEQDYRQLILDEYTFLKRPVFIVGEQIFIGNAKSNVAAVKAALEAS